MAMSPKPKAKKVLPKRPTGELPKRLSKTAARYNLQSGFEGARAQDTPSESAAAAGSERDRVKAAASKVKKMAAKSNLDAAALAKAKAKAKKTK